ncbi:Alpha/Beta hydrolase protein [Neofusicoccum parvum]|nr:Alpha/Beta hydrolase protein [Neofusicoccum parvum]
MTNQLQDIQTVDDHSYPYIFEQNVSVPLQGGGVIRCNVYRPKPSAQGQKYPVIATYGPYGKDIPYENFNPKSFAEVHPDQKAIPEHCSWETPNPKYWTSHNYVVVRADETGTGQSPGLLHILSQATIDGFYDLIEWASEQPWSTGKVGLLGISYYAATQWQVAARHPKGLAAIVPWEGFSDYYRDAGRHGGILSNAFFRSWYARQVAPNQYGLPGRAARNWGPDTVDGDLTEEELKKNMVPLDDFLHQRFRDDEDYRASGYNLEDVQVPLLSVANLGGILLHLRGNVEGFTHASSPLKYLRFIAGRHDLPFYYPDEVELQRSFLDAFLHATDRVGWATPGAVAPVSLLLRQGDVGHNNPAGEATFPRRPELEWPLARTAYTPFHLTPSSTLLPTRPAAAPQPTKLSYAALGPAPSLLTFTTPPFASATELTGHAVAHLHVSVSPARARPPPSDLDLFLSLRHVGTSGAEIAYTGTTGEAAPVTKGWLRASLRRVNAAHARHRAWLPRREYVRSDVRPVLPGEVYAVDVEMWPTCVVVREGERLVLEVAAGDTEGSGVFGHDDGVDRPADVFQGLNHIHFGPKYENYITLPVIPPK